jgi:hypothetical protein
MTDAGGSRFRRLLPVLAATVLVAAGAWLLPAAVLRFSRPVLLDFGPNDEDRISGFRPEWERDLRTRFHWTSPVAAVTLPLRLQGDHLLRLRMRRHFVDPAHVRLSVEGRTVAAFDLAADEHVPYQVRDVALPALQGRQPFTVAIEAPSDAGRPLGIALDWIEVRRAGDGARVALLRGTRVRVTAAALLVFALVLASGAGLRLATALGALLIGAAVFGAWANVLALERVVRLGLPSFAICAALGLALVRFGPTRRALGVHTNLAAGLALSIALGALALRLSLLLHPQFYYPDVKVHALFAWQLARRGFVAFVREFTGNQFRYSLGLQMENGHWYAFPYPPAFYVLAQPWIAAGYRPETAVALLAACVNGLEVLLMLAFARALRLGTSVGLAAAAVAAVLPIFLARLCLAYFPALVGHAVDAIAILFILARLDTLDWPRRVLSAASLIAMALLAYTQGLLNFAALLGLFLALDGLLDRSIAGRNRQVAVLACGVLGGVLAFGVFYVRYVPVMLDMARGRPQAEESIVLEKFARTRVDPAEIAAPEVDPYAGPTLDVLRGVRKAGWRLWVFYGPWTIALLAGLGALIQRTNGSQRRFVLAWAATFVVLNLASGSLPGPNLVRYNKDLEVVAPLACLALGLLAVRIARRSHVAGAIYLGLFVVFGILRASAYLTGTFSLER